MKEPYEKGLASIPTAGMRANGAGHAAIANTYKTALFGSNLAQIRYSVT